MYITEELESETRDWKVLDLDASTLAKMIAEKEITSREVTETFIDHIKNINPTINFLVQERFQKALDEANEVDCHLAVNKKGGKLFGVPISMKESFNIAEMETTGGLLNRKGLVQPTNAEVVQKLQDEGAIILGKTNTPELCFCQETDNKLYGRTNNARDLTKTAGGSSGGEAVMISVGGAAAGLGSDIGGSIRLPSHFNGVLGFKAGKGQVSAVGSYPPENHALQERMLGIGPITKSVRDARLLYNIVAKTPAKNKIIDDFTINVLPKTELPLSPTIRSLIDSVYMSIEKHFTTEQSIPPYFLDSAIVWQEIMSIDGAKGAGIEAFGNQPVRPISALIKDLLNGKARVHRYLSWALIGAAIFKPSDKRVLEIEAHVSAGDAVLNKYLDKRILVFPVYHTAAPKHGVVYKEIFSLRKTFQKYLPYVAYANVWGLPVLTIPVGTDEEGMPIAIQLISKNGNEEGLFRLGEFIEEKFESYVRIE